MKRWFDKQVCKTGFVPPVTQHEIQNERRKDFEREREQKKKRRSTLRSALEQKKKKPHFQ